MNSTGKKETIPETFESYEEAAEFWDTHDTTEFVEFLQPVEVDVRLQKRHFELEIDEDVVEFLQPQAKRLGISTGHLASKLLRQQMTTS